MPFLNFIFVLIKVINVNMSSIMPFFSDFEDRSILKYVESTNVSAGMHTTHNEEQTKLA